MKEAIIFTSFGATDSKVRTQTIDATVEDIKSAFPNIEVRQAYTSNFIRRKLNAQGLKMLSIEEQINSLRADGFNKIIILPSHLTPGEEFENKIKIFAAADIIILPPLFSLNCDTEFDREAFKIVLECFKINENEQLVLIGHGSPHRHNPVFENLQKLVDNEGLKVHIGVIESNDTPNFEDVIKRLQKNKATDILIAPLLFNGGSHINIDIAGDNDNSWKTRLIETGYNVRVCTEGLGTFKEFRQLYVKKLCS